jgi:hypothetical protein
MIANQPGVRAPDLASSVGRETKPFKIDVRKLKELGLTRELGGGLPPVAARLRLPRPYQLNGRLIATPSRRCACAVEANFERCDAVEGVRRA